MERLTEDSAKRLLKLDAKQITFPAVKSLTHSTARRLIYTEGRVALKGVRTIDKKAAKFWRITLIDFSFRDRLRLR